VRVRDDNTPLAGGRDVGPHHSAGASPPPRVGIFVSEKFARTRTVHVTALEFSENGAVFLPLQTCIDSVTRSGQTPNRRPTGKKVARPCSEEKVAFG
jgi:hypothetical protein